MSTKKQPAPNMPKKADTKTEDASGQWTSGEVIRDDAHTGQHPSQDTGVEDKAQIVGEGQGGKPAEDGQQWTAGQVIGEDPASGEQQRQDTGTYQAEQWVGEGQGSNPPMPKKKTSPKPKDDK